MQRQEWQIIDYFKQFIYGSICHDIEQCIKCGVNYVVALALLSYTEYLGGLISGNLGLKNKSECNFREALNYFPEEYRNTDSTLEFKWTDENGKTHTEKGIYGIFRCGLVHEYFIKDFATVYNDPSGNTENHIGVVKAERLIEWPKEHNIPPYKNKVLEFYTNEYFRDFKSAVGKIFKMIITDKDQKLLKGFNESLDRIYSRVNWRIREEVE
jgi:hypothetical protein